MKSKEEMLKWLGIPSTDMNGLEYPITEKDLFEVMDEWGKQEAIGFSVWLADNYDYDEFEKSWGKYWEVDEGVNAGWDLIPIDQLYSLYTESKPPNTSLNQ